MIKHISIILFLSISIAAVLIFFVFDEDEIQFKLIEKSESSIKSTLYHDYNRDGLSEQFYILDNSKTLPNEPNKVQPRYSIQVWDYSGIKILGDELNSSYFFSSYMVFFSDINNDLSDDIIFITKSDSQLFLNIFDLKNQIYIMKDFSFYTRRQNVDSPWENLFYFLAQDINNDGVKEIYLSVTTDGKALYPRDMFLIDATNQKVISTFETKCGIERIFFHDIDNNGTDEIIGISSAGGNSDEFGYNDWTARLWYLNLDLALFANPFNQGTFPDGILAKPITIKGNNFTLVGYTNNSNSEIPTYLALLNDKQNFVRKREFINRRILSFEVYNKENGENIIALTFHDKSVELYDDSFNILCSKKDFEKSVYVKPQNLIKPTLQQSILLTNSYDYFLFDFNLNSMGKLNFERLVPEFDIKKNELQNLLEIGIKSDNNFYLFSITQNSFYKSQIFIFLLFTFFLFIFLYSFSFLITRIHNVLLLYYTLIRKSDDAVLLVSSDGKILKFNKSTIKYFPEVKKRNNIYELGKNGLLKKSFDEIHNNGSISDNIKIDPLTENFHITGSRVQNLFLNELVYLRISKESTPDNTIIWTKSIQKIAHDIKTPLSTIKLNLKAIELKSEQNEHLLYFDELKTINSEIQRIQELTQNFLKFVNLEKPKFQSVDISQIINKSTDKFSSYFNNGCTLNIDICENCTSIWADPYQMEQLFQILIENAIDAISYKGIIEIKSSLINDLAHPDSEQILIEISDNGIGIDQNSINKIFDPYFTTKTKGTGLGLSIAKKIVEDHNGKLEVYSRVKLGTTFKIFLVKV